MAEIVFHDNNTYPYYSDDEKNNEFMDIESSNTTNSPERNDSQEGVNIQSLNFLHECF